MKIQCLAVDDEYLALNLLEDYISKVPYLHLVKKCKSALEALEIMQHQDIDIIFLDIQMPDLTGIDFLKSLANKPQVILTTAYQKYAVESYELDVTDYLLKPIRFERFLKAANKALSLIEKIKKPEVQNLTSTNHNDDPKSYFFVKSGFKSVKVRYCDILFFEGLKEYVNIYTKDNKFTKLERLKNIEQEIPAGKFIRVHKSYIIAIDKVDAHFGNTIEIGSKQIPIGRTYKEKVLRVIT